MSDNPVLDAARADVIKNILMRREGGMQQVASIAKEILDKLDDLDKILTEPPKRPELVPSWGDEKSRRVVDALLDRPTVLYGVLGVLHNIEIAGPWEHRPAVVTANGVFAEKWLRRNAKKGDEAAVLDAVQTESGRTLWTRWTVGLGRVDVADELQKAMGYADDGLLDRGWLLLPGIKER